MSSYPAQYYLYLIHQIFPKVQMELKDFKVLLEQPVVHSLLQTVFI